MLRKTAAMAALILVSAFANAQPQNYAQRGTNVRAGVLLIESAQQLPGVPANPTPFVWYNLDSNGRVKPAGWNFSNPVAPGQVTQEIYNRWTALSGSVGGAAPALYERVNKRNAAYWEVRLGAMTDVQMAQFDVLLLNVSGNLSLNSAERERLRNFVDRGGVLWVEVANLNIGNFNAENLINNVPIPFSVVPGANNPGNLDVFHPLLSYPYSFDISNLNYLNGTGNSVLTQATPVGIASALNPSIAQDWFKLKPVVLAGGNASMMVGRIGDGFMVVTTRNAAGFLNQINSGGVYAPNNQYYALDNRSGLDKGSDVLGKLAVNMVSLGSSSEQPSAGTRKSSSSSVDIGAPLLTRFTEPLTQLDYGQKSAFPVAAYKGLAVVVTNNQILVYDANPKSDLDGDGNPDDGLPDYSVGFDRDLVWTSAPLAGPISSATCVEVPQPAAGLPKDQILVTLSNGSVAAFNAFPTNPAGQIQPGPFGPTYTVASPDTMSGSASTGANRGPYAPTYHEGLAYVANNPDGGGFGTVTGQVWVFDPATGTPFLSTATSQRFSVGSSAQPVIQEISGAPTVGYIPIADNSGGYDKVVYLPTRPGGAGTPSAGIFSLWAGTRGETPMSISDLAAPATNLTVVTRASQRGLWIDTGNGPQGIKITVIDAAGNPLTNTAYNARFSGTITQSSPGVLEVGLNNAAGTWDVNWAVRVDYTVDWGRPTPQSIVRGNLFLPDDAALTGTARRQIIGNIAMSARGTIYVVHSTGSDTSAAQQGGAFYAFREQGQGAFTCVSRYDLYQQHTVNLNQAGSKTITPTVSDVDPLGQLIPILNGPSNKLTFVTGATVKGDYVYAGALLRKSGAIPVPFIPFTVIFAFKSEPELPEIQVGDLSEGFQLIQPDVTRSSSKTNPNILNLGTPGQFQYIKESGKIRFNSLMSSNRGQVTNAFSLSQPIILRSGGRPDQFLEPDRITGSRWSPLAWYTVFAGLENPTTPVVTGGTLFIGGSSALPNIIDGLGFAPTAVAHGMNADISERDPFMLTDPNRPWMRQVTTLQNNGGGNIKSNPNFRWPQAQGILTFEDWGLRIKQAAMPLPSNLPGRTMSIAAGEGAFFATVGESTGVAGGSGSLYSFSRADFVVCDEGRLGRFDPAGNPIFATDVTGNSGTETNVGTATSVRALQRPTRAYPVGPTDLVVVDPPTNRIVRLDGRGRELRSIDGFNLDPASGITLEANEPLTLNNPRDVQVFTEYVRNPVGVTAPQATEFWIHYVIADAGNRRIIDLIDRYSVGTNRVVGNAIQLSMLRWHSPAEYSGKRFEYNSIARAADPGTGRYFYIAGIGSATPTQVDIGLDTPGGTKPREARDGNGGIVIFDPFNANGTSVINEVNLPAIGNVLLNPTTGFTGPWNHPGTVKKLSNLTSVTVRIVRQGGAPQWAIMFTDATGVYEVTQTTSGAPWNVRWMLPNEAYIVLRNRPGAPAAIYGSNPLKLRANFARRLDSGEVLIVNGYVGRLLGGADFSGEVIQVDGSIDSAGLVGFDFAKPNFGFSFRSLRFELNTLADTRSLYQPVFADRR